MTDRHFSIGALVVTLVAALALAGCGGSQPAAPASQAPASGADSNVVKPLTGSEAQGDLGVKAADGTSPCGVFNVNGFGDKQATMADYPACTATKYKIMCLDDKAQWQPTYISAVRLSGDRKQIFFTSSQEGTCALFPSQ